jgi:hypothetical protein
LGIVPESRRLTPANGRLILNNNKNNESTPEN